jgi:amino acid adenylation domain-containing protein
MTHPLDRTGKDPPGPAVGEDEVFVFPASFAQRRLWFLDRLGSGSAYTIAHAGSFRLRGPLDVDALRRALAALVDRHESLRTTFREVEGEPMQVVAARGSVDLEVVHLTGTPEAEHEAKVERLARDAVERPFDLAAGPLFRARLVRLAERRHVLLLSLHHVISDGWSMGVLFRDLAALYAASLTGEPAALEPLDIQLADVAVWERERLRGERLRELLDFWRRRLEGAPDLRLALDREAPAVPSFRGGRVPLELSRELTAGLGALGRGEGATLFMTVLAGFFALLHRQTGADDLVVGAPIAHRLRREMEELIGFFVNALALRVDLAGDPSFRTLLGRVREACLGAYEHQELPFERLVEELRPEREASRHPLFQVAFALQDVPTPGLELAGLEVEALEFEETTVRFDLECHLWTREGRLSGHLLYASELFEAATMERLAWRYLRLLAAVAAEPDLPLSRLPLLDEEERRTLLVDWNGAVTDYPRDGTLHGLFVEHARRTPQAEALRFRDERLSYRELDERSNRLARRLLGLGVVPGAPVGLCLERSADAVLAQLAILKAGAAYLPLDPDWPRQRLEWTVADADLDLIVTRRGLVPRLAGTGPRLLALDDEREAIAALADEPLAVAVAAEDPAYVMYTSGSTGEPKGVVVPHRGVVRLVCGTDYLAVDADDVVLQVGPLAFDASTFEIWAALLHGALLVVFPQEELSLAALGDAIRHHGVTTALLTTPLFHQMVDDNLAGLAELRQLLTGGDVLSPDHARRALARLPGCPLLNAYGPTESTVIACCHRMEDASRVGATVPIGRPIANTRVYVLDEHRRLAPIGVVGELAIGGDGLARGYLGRPEATAERFVPDPFTSDPGARLYLTGDLARWRNDGSLEFHGRRDLQVKVRGFRVEPAEVEAALLAHPEVESAAVAGRPDADQGHRLVAWIVPRRSAEEAVPEGPDELVARWRELFEDTYREPPPAAAGADFAGWNSSYTGDPIPPEEMSEWIDETVARIAAFRPRRVLEIGCGTGLLLLRLARGCSGYLGTDFSSAALARLGAQLDSLDGGLEHVRLAQRTAEDFDGIGERSLDAIVLNSTVQYFPHADYLLTVLERAVAATADGGVIFVGDVRDLALLRAFHTSVALSKADPRASLEEVAARAAERVEREPELLLDPAFFARLPDRFPRIGGVEIRPKRGRHVNELALYRYDAILHVGNVPARELAIRWRERGREEWTAATVRAALATALPQAALGLRRLRDPRLERDLEALERIERPPARRSVAELEADLAALPHGDLTPDRLRAIAREHGRDAELAWPGPGAHGRFDVVFHPALADGSISPRMSLPGVAAARRDVAGAGAVANVPLARPLDDDLALRLRRFLAARLPAPMVPSAIVSLPRLPVGPTGKVDRKALPAPDLSPAGTGEGFVAPRDEIESVLIEVWERVLGRQGIGARDDFFDLGGHSLLGVRLVSEVEKRLGRRVPLQALFRFSTVERMATLLREAEAAPTETVAADRSSLSAGEVRDLLAAMAASELLPLAPGSLLAGFHRQGSRPPLFWCFNVPSYEPVRLAESLDADQPLYALLSGVGVLDWHADTPRQLAGHYLEQVLAVQPTGPYRLGGNCAGARVASALAELLRARGETVERLCLMEHFEPALYRHPGPMLLLYGRESHLEAHRGFGWPEPGWSDPFRVVPEVDWIPGAHGEFFDEENVGALAAALSRFLHGDG